MPLSQQKIEAVYGKFEYDEGENGRIFIYPDWVKQNIVTVPNRWGLETIAGSLAYIRCHRLIRAKLVAVFSDLYGQGLISEIKTYDGCYVPRHMSWNPNRSLSHHSWGIAVDVNVVDCPYGSLNAAQPAKVMSAFLAHGFEWGGCWKKRDPMHFEVVRL